MSPAKLRLKVRTLNQMVDGRDQLGEPMQRELDPHLFQSGGKDENTFSKNEPSFANSLNGPRPSVAPVVTMEVKEIKHMMGLMQRKIQELERRNFDLEGQLKESHQQSHVRLEKVIQSYQRFESAYQSFQKDVSEKLAQLQSRVNERRVSENRIEELFERQNMVFQNYEGRLSGLQKLISEKEMQLMNYASALRELRQEMIRLKR